MPESSRRELYRIVYPLTERPTLEVGRFLYEIVDVSEKGLRYEVKDLRMPVVGTQLGGVVQFRRGEDVAVTGEVIRSRGGLVVLGLEPSLPFAEVLAEQRYLRSKGYSLRE